MPREILVDWTNQGQVGATSVLYFAETTAVGLQRTALATFLTSCSSSLDGQTGWTIRTSGRQMDTTTGTLTGGWVDATTKTGVGTGTGEAAAFVTQILIRWHTLVILNGKTQQGRTFIPGLSNVAIVSGRLAGNTQTALSAAAQALCDANVNFGVWHRPTRPSPGAPRSGGAFSPATTGTAWLQLAALRRRRPVG